MLRPTGWRRFAKRYFVCLVAALFGSRGSTGQASVAAAVAPAGLAAAVREYTVGPKIVLSGGRFDAASGGAGHYTAAAVNPFDPSPSVGSSDTAAKPSIDDDSSGSTNVPIDSWIYPALERLAAMGLVPSQSISIRPLTRQECRRQIKQAEDSLYGFGSLDENVDDGVRREAERLLPELEYELQEPDGATVFLLESSYTRFGTIAGPALSDGFHFGQTWTNDLGRPLGRGSSAILGYSARATSGRLFLYVRQEMQTSPGSPPITQAESTLFNQLDNIPFIVPGSVVPPAAIIAPTPALSASVRQRPIEMYAGTAARISSVSGASSSVRR